MEKYQTDSAKKNEAKALQEFYRKFPDYDPISDADGVLFRKLTSYYVARSGTSVEDILKDLEDAHYLLNRENETPEATHTPFDDSGVGPIKKAGDQESKPIIKLTPEQKQIAKNFGMSEKAYWESIQTPE